MKTLKQIKMKLDFLAYYDESLHEGAFLNGIQDALHKTIGTGLADITITEISCPRELFAMGYGRDSKIYGTDKTAGELFGMLEQDGVQPLLRPGM